MTVILLDRELGAIDEYTFHGIILCSQPGLYLEPGAGH